MKILVLILISTLYLNCVANAETLMPIGFKGKWGFVSEYGKLVITPQFDDAGDFYEGLAPIKVKGGSSSLMDRAAGPSPIIISSL